MKQQNLYTYRLLLWVVFLSMFFSSTVKSEDETEQSIDLEISWEIPDKFTNGDKLEPDEIKGFDVFYEFNEQNLKYLGWVEYEKDNEDYKPIFLHKDIKDHGKYCYEIRTVTFIFGKSEDSPAVCYEYKPPDFVEPVTPGNSNPCYPVNIFLEDILHD